MCFARLRDASGGARLTKRCLFGGVVTAPDCLLCVTVAEPEKVTVLFAPRVPIIIKRSVISF